MWAVYDRTANAYFATGEGIGYIDSFDAAFKWPTREAAQLSYRDAILSVKEELLATDVAVTAENIAKLVPYTKRAARLRKRLLKQANALRLERDDLQVNDGPHQMIVALDEAIEAINEAIHHLPRRYI